MWAKNLAGAAAEDDDLGGVEQDYKIEENGKVLHVIQIVLKLLTRFLDGSGVWVADLRPAGDARRHQRTELVVGQLLLELVDERRALGARTDDAHVAADDVDDLRQLV